jgi:hypothetical protein
MRVLTGIPVFRIPDSVRRCLEALVHTPTDIFVVDNAADADVREVVKTFGDRIKVEVSPTNEFCNGGWNRIMKYGLENNYDVIGLGSSDATLHPGWYYAVCSRFRDYSGEVLIPSVREPITNPDHHKATTILPTKELPGFYMFIVASDVKKVYPIPAQMRHWYGDTYILGKLRNEEGRKITLLEEVGAYHEQGSVTFRTSGMSEITRQDEAAWVEYQRVRNSQK